MELKRWNGIVALMEGETDPEGPFVLHADAQAALAEKDATIRRMREALQLARKFVEDEQQCAEKRRSCLNLCQR